MLSRVLAQAAYSSGFPGGYQRSMLLCSLIQSKSVVGDAGKPPSAAPSRGGRTVSGMTHRWLCAWPSANERLAAPLW